MSKKYTDGLHFNPTKIEFIRFGSKASSKKTADLNPENIYTI